MARIFGIDLGTTNSLIAAMDNGAPRVIADSRDQRDPASESGRRDCARWRRAHVGSAADQMEPHLSVEKDGRVSAVGFPGGEYGAVIRSVKRYMGLGGAEVAPEDRARYTFADLVRASRTFSDRQTNVFTPPQISAEILKALKDRALNAR